jgi:hypothetical protein
MKANRESDAATLRSAINSGNDLPAELTPFEDVAIYPKQSGFVQ